MFDIVVLLCGPIEQTTLAALLRRHNPRLTLRPAQTLADLQALPQTELQRARLIAFLTPVIVPKPVLDALGYGGYNFHPGPPQYPGWLPSHFAVYDRVARFGVTAHRMIERVDAGPIVGVTYFDVAPDTPPLTLEQRAFVEVAKLFWHLSPALATQSEPLAALPVTWSGRKTRRRHVIATCDIEPDMDASEIDRRLAAFGHGAFGIHPTIMLHGHRFRYVPPEPAATDETAPPAPSARKMSAA
jgi:methionyl-tRNA formyltransferase